MVVKEGGPIIMRYFSIFPPVFEVGPDEMSGLRGQLGVSAVQAVSWWETRGGKETLISEKWRLVAPNMFVST